MSYLEDSHCVGDGVVFQENGLSLNLRDKEICRLTDRNWVRIMDPLLRSSIPCSAIGSFND